MTDDVHDHDGTAKDYRDRRTQVAIDAFDDEPELAECDACGRELPAEELIEQFGPPVCPDCA